MRGAKAGVSPPRRIPPRLPYFIISYNVYTRLRVKLVAGLRYVPFLQYVVLLGVM